jgi:nucleotidyltransferase substrate binding protein (TIGR01987 family)
MEDIRWQQRFQNFEKALLSLNGIQGDRVFSDIEIDGFIQRFEITFELAWKVLQDYFYEQGYTEYKEPKKVLTKAFQDGLFEEGELWLSMLEDRNILTHVYDYNKSREVFEHIKNQYFHLLNQFYERFKNESSK